MLLSCDYSVADTRRQLSLISAPESEAPRAPLFCIFGNKIKASCSLFFCSDHRLALSTMVPANVCDSFAARPVGCYLMMLVTVVLVC